MDKPYRILCGDSLSLLASLETASIDACITDPPYSSGGMTRGDRAGMSARDKYATNDSVSADEIPGFSGDNRDQLAFVLWCSLWLAEVRRILKPGACAFVFTDWRQLPATMQAMQCGGIVLRGVMPWHKPASRPQQGRLSAACEYVVWGSAGPLPNGGACVEGFYSESPPKMTQRQHLTQKPRGVVEHILKLVTPGGLVLDPFAGSGTTGEAAIRQGYRFVGIDCEQHWCDVTAKRCEASRPLFA